MERSDTGRWRCGSARGTGGKPIWPLDCAPVNGPVYAASLFQLLAHCAAAVAQVRQGRSLTDVLDKVPAAMRPGVQSLSFHVLRWMGAAEALRERLVPRRPEASLDALLLSALALLWPPGRPPYAAHTLVDESVKAARLRHARQAGFVNAVLRRYLREQDALRAAVAQDERALTNHPDWWVQRLRADWGAQAGALMKQAQEHPPMALRVNPRRVSRADYCRLLETQGIAYRLGNDSLQDQLVLLDQPLPVNRLPGFDQGWVSVQDAHAQLAAVWLLGSEPCEGWRVLDACAAPGGKTAHLLERAELDLLALDSDPQRLGRVQNNLRRLGLEAALQATDAADTAGWWDGRPFDAILLDAPCSGSGVVRRHPDIRWLRRPTDIPALAATQLRLLQALWPLLKPGGRLLFATCSVFKAEGQDVVDAFLQRVDVTATRLQPGSPGHLLPLPQNGLPVDAEQNTAAETSAVAVPGGPAGDGFFYALLAKPSLS